MSAFRARAGRGRSGVVLPPWAQVTEVRIAHIVRVAELVAGWADALDVPAEERERWLRAVSFHDALKDAPMTLQRELAPDAWGEDALRHGPAAAHLAARHGETDRGVLDAVRYHSVGYVGWDRAGRMLYVGDYLEPDRAFHGEWHRELIARVPEEPDAVFREVVRDRIRRLVTGGRPLLPETVDLWNVLARAD